MGTAATLSVLWTVVLLVAGILLVRIAQPTNED